MDIVDQVGDTSEEEGASVKVYKDRRKMKKSKPPKQNVLSKQEYYIPPQVLNAKETPQGQPLHKKYGFIRADKMSCKHCNRPPFHTKIGLAVHMMDEHGIDSEGSEEEEEEEIMELKRSSRDVPVHLDYREQESSEEELSEIEAVADVSESDVEVIDGVVDSDDEDEENRSQDQKRDASNAELRFSPLRKVQKTDSKTITLGKKSGGPMDPGASDPNNNQSSDFFEEVMNEFMQM